MEVREIYCPGHFGNSYEAMWPREMAKYLVEMKYWGFNCYGDWLDTADIGNPYTAYDLWPREMAGSFWNLPLELLARKKAALRAAADLGMALDLVVTPNNVYLDQLRPDLMAVKSRRTIGQLLCPSKPDAYEIICDNFDRLFKDMAQSEIQLSFLTAYAYDFGGCACDECAPWILTFARLFRDVHRIACQYFPEVKPRVCTWWWTNEEYHLFDRWMAHETSDWLQAIVVNVPYGQVRMEESPMSSECKRHAFLHLGYGDVANNGDLYGKYGPAIAPDRLCTTLDATASQGATGFQAYSEGVFDDVNKAIAGALSADLIRNADEALNEYAARYLDTGNAARWARWLASWGDRTQANITAARAEFERMAPRAKQGWRLEQLRSKLSLEELDRKLSTDSRDSAEARALLADRFWSEQEHLQRDVYHLGPVRFIISPKIGAPPWSHDSSPEYSFR